VSVGGYCVHADHLEIANAAADMTSAALVHRMKAPRRQPVAAARAASTAITGNVM
jgi:hypothetical protein